MPIAIKILVLISSAVFIVALSFLVYAAFYLNWGEKHYDVVMKTPLRFINITQKKSAHVLMYKITTIASLILMIFLFIYTLIYK